MGKVGRLARRSVFCAAVLSVTVACTAVYRDHGYVPTEHELAAIQVGDSRAHVEETVGRPTTTGVLTDSAWYYVQSRWRHYGALAPEPIDRQLLAISFNPQGNVSNVERFTLEDGRVVVLSRRVTETSVQGVGFIRQLLGNVGRLRADQFLDNN